MNLLLDQDSASSGIANRRSESPGCGLDCKEELFSNLANRSQLCILDTLCEGAKTVSQIAGATGLSQFDVSNHLEPLLDCGCVTQRNADHSVLYGLSVPRLLQLEGIVDEMLIAALKGHRAYD
jgi:DNA-binding transcriptional ArsR family regulator